MEYWDSYHKSSQLEPRDCLSLQRLFRSSQCEITIIGGYLLPPGQCTTSPWPRWSPIYKLLDIFRTDLIPSFRIAEAIALTCSSVLTHLLTLERNVLAPSTTFLIVTWLMFLASRTMVDNNQALIERGLLNLGIWFLVRWNQEIGRYLPYHMSETFQKLQEWKLRAFVR
jgi:hypothetical protein